MPTEVNTEVKEWDFRDYIDLFYRRITLIITLFTVTFIITLIYQFTQPAIYGSSTTFTIDESTSTSGVGSERYSPYANFMMEQGKPLEYYQSIVSSPIYLAKLQTRVLQDSALVPVTAERELEIMSACNSMSLTKDDKSGLITLYVRARSPLVAYRAAEISAEVFRERNQQIELEGEQNIVRFIDKQRQDVQDRLEQAERDLQKFDGAGTVYVMTQDGGTLSKVNQVEALLELAETQRRLAETNLASFEMQLSGVSKQNNDLLSADSVREIANLRKRLSVLDDQRNAMMIAAKVDSLSLSSLDRQIKGMKSELRRLIIAHSSESLPAEDKKSEELRAMLTQRLVAEQVELSSTRNKERFYANLLEQYRRQSPELLEKTIELSRLKRTQAVHQNLLNYLVERHEEAKIKAATGAGSIRIIDPAALPSSPLSRRLPRNLMVGAILGLGLGFSIAMLLDHLDQTVRDKEGLERLTGIQVIGQIPFHMKTKVKNRAATAGIGVVSGLWARLHKNSKSSKTRATEYFPLIHQINVVNVHAPFTEAFRGLRTDLQFFRIDKPIKKYLITSSISSEGKSVITANLALSYAELGFRVVIVDADLRRPKQDKLFSIARRPGLVEYLIGKATYDEVIRPLKIPGLFLIPAGTIPPNPTEIINSKKMVALINQLEKEFDYVLIDSPPIINLSDAKMLSRIVEHVLMVFRFGRTEKHYVKEAVDSLRNIDASIVGFVLNGIAFGLGKGYYKYHYYYASPYNPSKEKK